MGIKSTLAAMTLKAKVVIVCAAVAVTGGTAAGIGIAMTREEAYRVLKVFELTGSAVVERDGSGELDAYTGMNLESGDTLTVGDESTIRISLDDDKYILLDSGTILELNASGTAADSRTAIDLKQGSILNEITNPLSEKSSYEVATPKATMAVRGTSFVVTVDKDDDGVYMINENTLHGKVEIELIDNKGNRTGKKAFTSAGGGVMICTEPDENSGNPAEIDGTSKFVIPNGKGGFYIAENGEDPTFDINYDSISSAIKNTALRSNDEDVMPLSNEVLENLRGFEPQTESSVTTTVTTTQTTTTAVTTVPETTETEEETTITAAPVTTVTTVPETEAYVPQTKPTTTAKTTVPTTKKSEKKTKKTKKETEKTTVTTEETTETTTERTTETTEETTETTTETTTVTTPPHVPSHISADSVNTHHPTETKTETAPPTYPPTDPDIV